MTDEERIAEFIFEIKKRLENVDGISDDDRRSYTMSHFADFCRVKEYLKVPSDIAVYEEVAVPFVADFDAAVFTLEEVDEAFIDGKIPAEWK